MDFDVIEWNPSISTKFDCKNTVLTIWQRWSLQWVSVTSRVYIASCENVRVWKHWCQLSCDCRIQSVGTRLELPCPSRSKKYRYKAHQCTRTRWNCLLHTDGSCRHAPIYRNSRFNAVPILRASCAVTHDVSLAKTTYSSSVQKSSRLAINNAPDLRDMSMHDVLKSPDQEKTDKSKSKTALQPLLDHS